MDDIIQKFLTSVAEAVSVCHSNDVIAYGTGKVGKLLIPYLAQNKDSRLLGVTNSHTARDEVGTFEDTGLPIRSPEFWYEKYPEATIMITTSRPDYYLDIARICWRIGFRNIICIDSLAEKDIVSIQLNALVSSKNRPLFELLLPNVGAYLVDQMCIANQIRDIHKVSFAEFRECHKNQSVVVVGSGPTLNYYSQLEHMPHIGVNSTFLHPKIKLDYFFARDYASRSSLYDDLKNYNFVKFLGIVEWTSEAQEIYQVPESVIMESQARRFITQPRKEYIHCDIEHYPVMGLGSIIFGAFHFALFTMPKQIFLVGCDCAPTGHYDGSGGVDDASVNEFVNSWKWVKMFIKRYYPSIEVISINPVGLKGVFRDVYTESYVEAHPEIRQAGGEILNKENYGSAQGQ